MSRSVTGRTHERLARMQESYAGQATSTWLEALERSLAQMKEYQVCIHLRNVNMGHNLNACPLGRSEEAGESSPRL